MRLKIVSILVVVLVLVMNVQVYANTLIPDPPSDPYAWPYWVIVEDLNGDIYFYESSNQIYVTKNEDQIVLKHFRQYVYRDENWDFIYSNTLKEYLSFKNILKSNHDIYYEDGSDVFFYMNRREANRLHRVVRKVDFGTFLRIFLVGLPPVIGLIILSIAFRKAWQFLQNQFKGC